MTNLKCIRCGALNLDTAAACRVCQVDLNPVRPSFAWRVQQPPTLAWTQGSIRSNTTTPIRPFHQFGDVLGPALHLFIKNIWLITKLTFVIVAPFEIFKTLSVEGGQDSWELTIGTYTLDALCRVLIAPALIYALMRRMETGTRPGINESYSWGFSKLGKLIVCALLAWLLTGLGLALCIVPGIIIGVALELVFPLAILEKGSPADVLRRSAELTKGRRGEIFGALFVLWLLIGIISLPTLGAVTYMQRNEGGFLPLQIGAAIFVDILEQAKTVMSLVIYLSIRALWSQGTQ